MKTSIVYVTVKCVVEHDDDQDPAYAMCDADYNVSFQQRHSAKVIDTEMTETNNMGECHPTEHFLL